MLKRLYIDNFRCFVNFEYKPERKQLLLGANGSGKSSLLDAVRVLKAFVSAQGDNVELRRAFQSSRTKWLNLPSQVFELQAEIEGAQYIYRLENDVSNPNWPASVAAESLTVDGATVMEGIKGEMTLYAEGGAGPIAKIGVGNSSSALALLRPNRKETRLFVDWLSKQLFCLRIRPDSMRPVGKLDGQTHPFEDVSDLASWYMHLAGTDVEGVIKLRNSLRETLDGFASLHLMALKAAQESNVVHSIAQGNLSRSGLMSSPMVSAVS